MNRFVGYILLIAVVMPAGVAQGRTAPRVYAKIDSDMTIYPGQAFTYSVVAEGSKPTQVDVSALARFNPRRAGSGSSFQTIGDRTTVSYTENYVIVAGQPGTMVLPGVTVVVDGQTYITNPVQVTVSAPGTTDRMTVDMTLSQQRCYVGQPVVMTVEWIVSAQVKDVAFDVPAFRSDMFYVEDMAELPTAYARQQTEIEGVPVVVLENRRLVNGMEAAIISFSKVLIPKRSGPVTLDPVAVSTDMATRRIRTADLFNPVQTIYERFSVHSDPVVLEVLPLPDTDRPAQFYGLVGPYTISASATPTQVNVGDPITLTIRVGGNPYLKPVQWPELEKVPGLAENFRVPLERASPVIENGEKVFTQTVRANNDHVAAIPAIPLAHFDPGTGAYVVAKTEPIPLKVSPTRVLTPADVEGMSAGRAGRDVQAIREGFSANYYGFEILANQRFSPVSAAVSGAYLALWSIPLAALFGSALFKFFTQTSPEVVARKRRRQACSTALRQIKAIASSEARDRHGLLVSALKTYLGDRLDRVAGSLTDEDCYEIVAAATGDRQLADRFKAKISELDAARYAAFDAEIDSAQIEDAIDLLGQVEKELKR